MKINKLKIFMIKIFSYFKFTPNKYNCLPKESFFPEVIDFNMCFSPVVVTGGKPWSYILNILRNDDTGDTEMLVFAMTLLNKVLCHTVHMQVHISRQEQLQNFNCSCYIYMTRVAQFS